MESLFQQNHHILSLSKSDDDTYIIADKENFIGKLTFMLSNDSIALFDNKHGKYIFEKIGFRKPIIKILSSPDNNVRYILPCSLRKNASLNILGKVSHVSIGNGFLWSIYWEWHIEFTGETILSYSQSIDSEYPITVKIGAPEKIFDELNILCAVGCFILLNHEHITTRQARQLQQVNQLAGYVEEHSVNQIHHY